MGRGQKWYRKQRTQRTHMYNPWTWTKGRNAGGLGGKGQGGKAENWENCNSIINKIYLKLRKKKGIYEKFIIRGGRMSAVSFSYIASAMLKHLPSLPGLLFLSCFEFCQMLFLHLLR